MRMFFRFDSVVGMYSVYDFGGTFALLTSSFWDRSAANARDELPHNAEGHDMRFRCS